jgi:hypothetical protein
VPKCVSRRRRRRWLAASVVPAARRRAACLCRGRRLVGLPACPPSVSVSPGSRPRPVGATPPVSPAPACRGPRDGCRRGARGPRARPPHAGAHDAGRSRVPCRPGARAAAPRLAARRPRPPAGPPRARRKPGRAPRARTADRCAGGRRPAAVCTVPSGLGAGRRLPEPWPGDSKPAPWTDLPKRSPSGAGPRGPTRCWPAVPGSRAGRSRRCCGRRPGDAAPAGRPALRLGRPAVVRTTPCGSPLHWSWALCRPWL